MRSLHSPSTYIHIAKNICAEVPNFQHAIFFIWLIKQLKGLVKITRWIQLIYLRFTQLFKSKAKNFHFKEVQVRYPDCVSDTNGDGWATENNNCFS